MVGVGGGALGWEAKSGADVGDGRLELVDGELTVLVLVELLELMVDEAAEHLLVPNQPHYFRTVHYLLLLSTGMVLMTMMMMWFAAPSHSCRLHLLLRTHALSCDPLLLLLVR